MTSDQEFQQLLDIFKNAKVEDTHRILVDMGVYDKEGNLTEDYKYLPYSFSKEFICSMRGQTL